MSLKDKLDERKQQKEAKEFFRDNNDLYLNNNDLVKTILIGLVSSLLLGFASSVISSNIGYIMFIIYIGMGLLIAKIMVKVSGVQSKQVAMISAVFTFVAIIASSFFTIFLPMYTNSLFIISFGRMFLSAFKMIFTDPFELVMTCFAIYTAYENAK